MPLEALNERSLGRAASSAMYQYRQPQPYTIYLYMRETSFAESHEIPGNDQWVVDTALESESVPVGIPGTRKVALVVDPPKRTDESVIKKGPKVTSNDRTTRCVLEVGRRSIDDD